MSGAVLPGVSENRRGSKPNPRQEVATRPAQGSPSCGYAVDFAACPCPTRPIEDERVVKRSYELRRPRTTAAFFGRPVLGAGEHGFLIPSPSLGASCQPPTTRAAIWVYSLASFSPPSAFPSSASLSSRILAAKFE